jgi:serine protease Do
MKALKIKHIFIALVIVLVILVSSCSTLDTNGSAPTGSGSPVDDGGAPPSVEDGTLVLPSIADVVALVKPSVVAINVEVTSYDIFNRPYTQQGAGSGWIIDEDGIIVTNNHVVEGADSITVTLDDGRIFPVDTDNVATDSVSDVAVLKIDANNLPAVAVGNSANLRVGDWVVAIGNALGEGISATNGIVSRNDVSITDETGLTRYNLIQTNAAINPGNSGGPLVNLDGEVIGITNAKISAVGVEGMGYAISSDSAMPIIEELIQNGYVVRPFLGVQNLLTVDQSVAAYYGLSVNTGAMIRGVMDGGPADAAGLEAGDVITKFGDQETADVNELLQALYSAEIGQDVEITFWRGSSQQTAHIILEETPPPS